MDKHVVESFSAFAEAVGWENIKCATLNKDSFEVDYQMTLPGDDGTKVAFDFRAHYTEER